MGVDGCSDHTKNHLLLNEVAWFKGNSNHRTHPCVKRNSMAINCAIFGQRSRVGVGCCGSISNREVINLWVD